MHLNSHAIQLAVINRSIALGKVKGEIAYAQL